MDESELGTQLDEKLGDLLLAVVHPRLLNHHRHHHLVTSMIIITTILQIHLIMNARRIVPGPLPAHAHLHSHRSCGPLHWRKKRSMERIMNKYHSRILGDMSDGSLNAELEDLAEPQRRERRDHVPRIADPLLRLLHALPPLQMIIKRTRITPLQWYIL